MEFTWKRGGFRFNPIDAMDAGEALMAIHNRDGGIEPEQVVREAAKKRSPLHPAFEWDDSTAAHQYRISQARDMVRSIAVLVETPAGEQKTVHAFVHVPAAVGERPRYVTLESLKSSPADYARALNHLLGMVEQMERSIDELRAAALPAGVSEESIARVQKRVVDLREAALDLPLLQPDGTPVS